MTKKCLFLWIFLFSVSLFFSFGPKVFAVSNSSSYDQQLQDINAERAKLQAELAQVEAQISQFQKDLTKIGAQKDTLAKKIAQLRNKEAQLTLQIKKTSLQLDEVQIEILQVQADIGNNNQKILLFKDQLSVIVKRLWQLDRYSSFNILLGSRSFSSYYDRLHNFQIIGNGLNQFLNSLHIEERSLQDNQALLAARREDQQNYLEIIDLQKKKLTANLQDQSDLLSATKGKEANYKKMLTDSKAQANKIRNRMYSLIAVSQQITFGQAVQIATWAGSQTGVRPALLLGVLTQESNLGKNVGTCNRKGDPPSKSWKVVMKPDRDQKPFLQITSELGRDPDTTPISCPMKGKDGKQIGWGGAMGPAQFIPSTWMGYKNKITAITGKAADPWDIRDAFLAASLKLAADGGTSKNNEWAAAMKYFSGGTNLAYRFYGDNVVEMADKYQNDIDQLNNN